MPDVRGKRHSRIWRDPDRTPTYFERADWHELASLDAVATLKALAEPAQVAGRPFDRDAVDYLAAQTGGYPYAIQLYGHHAWRASDRREQINLAAVKTAAITGREQLERGLYARRWAQCSPKEREYLVAVAELLAAGGPVTGGAVARAFHVAPAQLSSYRARLLTKGTLTAEGDQLRFPVPGMGAYVLKTHDQQAGSAPVLRGRRKPPPPGGTIKAEPAWSRK